jgi:hypothetical protein
MEGLECPSGFEAALSILISLTIEMSPLAAFGTYLIGDSGFGVGDRLENFQLLPSPAGLCGLDVLEYPNLPVRFVVSEVSHFLSPSK